jgi:hypothetical protein
MPQTKVAMIGDGNVGTALSKGLVRAGYEVQAIGKVPEKVRELARWGDIIVLAVPFTERANALKEMGDAFAGKPLVDVTNAFGREDTITQKSGAEELQEMARTAKVVKAFNTAFAHTMSTGQVLGTGSRRSWRETTTRRKNGSSGWRATSDLTPWIRAASRAPAGSRPWACFIFTSATASAWDRTRGSS